MSTPEQAERAAALLERLLSDPSYRSEFRADPAGACAAEGLPEVAAQLGRGRALETLEIRESRSSLAGVLMAAALEGASLAVLVDHAQAASTVDPDAAKALAQLTQNGQPAVPPPPAVPVDATTPVAGAPPAVEVTTTPGAPLPTDTAPAPPPVDAAPPPPPPVVDPPAAVAPPPAVDVIDSPPPTTTAAVSAGPGVQFLPAVSATDPPPVAGVDQVAPLSASAPPPVPVAPAQPVTGVLQQVAQQQPAAVQAPATVGALPAVPAVADHVDALAIAGGPNPYPGDGAPPEAIAAWMARDAQAAGLPPELPVMASLVESGLHNLTGRRPRLGRLLPDAHGHLGSRSVRRLPAEPRAADALVHRSRTRDQGQAHRRGRCDVRPGSQHLRQLGRRRRGAVRALPRALPATPRRCARAARPGRVGTALRPPEFRPWRTLPQREGPRFRPPMSRDR